jgi:hypothetical protein
MRDENQANLRALNEKGELLGRLRQCGTGWRRTMPQAASCVAAKVGSNPPCTRRYEGQGGEHRPRGGVMPLFAMTNRGRER